MLGCKAVSDEGSALLWRVTSGKRSFPVHAASRRIQVEDVSRREVSRYHGCRKASLHRRRVPKNGRGRDLLRGRPGRAYRRGGRGDDADRVAACPLCYPTYDAPGRVRERAGYARTPLWGERSESDCPETTRGAPA